MPTIIVQKPLAETKKIQLIVECDFPPVTLADGSVKYGTIQHIEFKGLDVDGNQAGNAYYSHDETPHQLKADLVTTLLTHATSMAAGVNATIDLNPAPYVPPVVEEVEEDDGN